MIAIGSPDLTFRSVTFVATFISSHGANAPKCNASLFPPSIPPALGRFSTYVTWNAPPRESPILAEYLFASADELMNPKSL